MGDPSAGMMVVAQRHTDQPEASVSGGSHIWGTWEELLLASAVKRHGTDNWNLVSLELQARARVHSVPPSFYTAQACRSKYYAIKRRYCGDDERDAELGKNMPWFEELRKLRVAHLKRELEHYDGSIGSLQTKLKRLKAEKSQTISKQFGKAIASLDSDAFDATPVKKVQAADARIRSSEGCVTQPFNERFDDFLSDVRALPRHDASLVSRRDRRGERVEASDELKGGTLESKGQLETHIHGHPPSPSHDLLTSSLVGVREPERGDKNKVEVVVPEEKMGGMGPGGTTEWKQSMVVHDADAQVVDSNKEGSTDARDDPVVQITCFQGDQSNGLVPTFETIEAKGGAGNDDKAKLAELLTGSGDAYVFQSQTINHTIKQAEEWYKGEGKILQSGSVAEGHSEVKNARIHETRRGSASLPSNETTANCLAETNVADRYCERGDADHRRVDDDRGNIELLDVKCCFSGDKEDPSANARSQEKPQLNFTNNQTVSGRIKEPALSSLPLGSQSESAHLVGLEDLSTLELESTSCCSKVPIQKAVGTKHRSPAAIARNTLEDVCQSLHLEPNEHVEATGVKDRVRVSPCPPAIEECKQNLSAESADSTEHGGPTLEREALCQDEKTGAQKMEINGGSQSLASRELTTSERLRFKGRQKSSRSIEKLASLEVSGESIEVTNRRDAVRTIGQGRERKFKMSPTKDLGSACKDSSEATDSIKPIETSVRTGSFTTSHEGSGSMNNEEEEEEEEEEEDKECDDTEGWQKQTGRYSGDSQVEKSEAGSLMDGNEDISPMSRRHRREPKVAGKLLPLLDCLRSICAHKCAPLFKHKQETQEHIHYDHLIRSHIDLTLIRARLEEGFYSGSVHFFRDLLLMINNALVYYSRESQEFIAAIGLREFIKKVMSHTFETEALLKQDRPSTRKRVPKRPNSTVAGSATPGKQQGRKRGRTPLKEPSISEVIAKSGGLSKDGDADGLKMAIADKGKKPRDEDFPKAGKDLSSSILKEEPSKLTGVKMENKHSILVGKPKGMKRTAKGRINSLAKGLKQSNDSGEEGQQANRTKLAAVGDEPKVVFNDLAKVMEGGTKLARTKVMGNGGQALKVSKAPHFHSQPVKRGVGRPPKHSLHQGIVPKTKDQEEAILQQKKKLKL